MNLVENDVNEVNNKNKKTMRILVVLMIIVILISAGIMAAIYYLQQTEFKFTIDAKSIKTYSSDLFIFYEDKVYISIKDMAPLVDYKAYNGAYGSQEQYSEDNTKCYVEGKDEVASFELDSNLIYKIITTGSREYEYYEIDEPVLQAANGKLYTTVEGISRAYNISFTYSKNNNRITVYSLPYLVGIYENNNKNASLSSFNNQKALLYNLLVTSNGENASSTSTASNIRYGVNSLDGVEIIGAKYQDIQFIESAQEFLVKTTAGKVGIISSNGTTKIQPQYDEIKQIDKDSNLYLAVNNGKQGVIDENGKIIVYLEYDKIGINSSDFSANNIKNSYLLYNNCIPVCQNDKWGIYDKTGKQILPIEYDSLGCIVNNKVDNANSIIIIPDIKAIVVCKKSENNSLYGIVNFKGKQIVPIALTSVYSVINQGKQDYYMVNLGKTYNVIEWVNSHIELNEINE